MLAVSLVILELLPFAASPARAQDNSNHANRRLMIDSTPRGAYVEISGRYSFVGRTPFVIPYKLVGRYQIEARLRGFESVKTSVNLAARGANQITLRLARKTPFKASYRSLILPGWGQFYGQNKLKGFTVALTQVGLGIATLAVHGRYLAEKEQFDLALSQYERFRTDFDRRELALLLAQKELKEADAAYKTRNVMLWVTAGFWAYNVLDSMLFFSKRKSTSNKSVRFTPYFTGGGRTSKFMMSLNVGL